VPIDLVLAELRKMYERDYDGHRLTKADVLRWSSLMGIPVGVLCDRISAYLVRGFHQRTLSFEFCDAIVNRLCGIVLSEDLYGVVFNEEGEFAPLFWKTYQAFDAGEFFRPDKPDEDPIEAYTRPLVAQIIAELPA
jgi:hypothetical protein